MIEFIEYKTNLLNIKDDVLEMKKSLDIENAQKRLSTLEKETENDEFWSNPDESQIILKEIKNLKDTIEKYDILNTTWDDLYTICELALESEDDSMREEIRTEYPKFVKMLENLRLQTLLCEEYDKLNAIVSFQAGAGGTEAQDWAEMLYRMHTRFAERKGFSYKILNYLNGDGAGIKSADILVEGDYAFGYLKSEMGVHRLVRISPFDSSGRRHTSFAAVEVMPEIIDDSTIEINSDDLRVDTYRASGAGGQHINKTESAIRITHIPSGVVVSCQSERSQHQNRDHAMKMLMSKLVQIKQQQHLDKIEDIKGEQKKIEWGSQIRSYTFMPYTLVKDHRTNFENGNTTAVMDGDLEGFVNAYLQGVANNTLLK
ncbi:MAG: peptide chain release factor 2 [Clostridia bacterium]